VFDLHIHTTHSSDGQHTPIEIMLMAQKRRLAGLAFTDHMDISAVPEGMELAGIYGLHFFPGVEISTISVAQEYHILIYGFNPGDAFLMDFLSYHCIALWEKAQGVIDILFRMGFDIRKEDVDGWGRSVPTGVSFLNALKKRNAEDIRLYDYLSGSKSSSPYLNFYRDFASTDIGVLLRSSLPDLKETIRLFRDHGLLVLAHPGHMSRESIEDLKNEGVTGIEAYSSHHTKETARYLVEVARSLDLLVSAGSDYHGELIKPGIDLGDMTLRWDDALIRKLTERSP
jgi:predicted metal-dependent phosphoesterase TrpH